MLEENDVTGAKRSFTPNGVNEGDRALEQSHEFEVPEGDQSTIVGGGIPGPADELPASGTIVGVVSTLGHGPDQNVERRRIGWRQRRALVDQDRPISARTASARAAHDNELGALIASAFLGAESLYLLGLEKKGSPIRPALRRIGDLIRILEAR